MRIKRYGPRFDGCIHEPVSPRVALDPNHHARDSLEAAVRVLSHRWICGIYGI